MRVGIDASNLRTGGGVTHLTELLRAADPRAAGVHEVVVWGSADTLARLPPRQWLTPRHQPALDRPLPHRLAWQRFTLATLAEAHCDLLFSPGGSYMGRYRPFVTMSRNLLPFQASERRRYGPSWMFVKMGLLRRGQAATFRRAGGVIFLNDYARACVVAETGTLPGETTVIPHGIDATFCARPRPQPWPDAFGEHRPFRLLYVSTVDMYKHQWHVAEAVHILRQRGIPVTLDLVGAAYPPALARLQATLGRVDPRGSLVRYVGPLPHAALPARYQAADAFVFASSCENMPNILLEAMAAGLPIACAERGPMPSVLGDAGLYFDPEVPQSIAAAVERLYRDAELRRDLATRAFHRARQYSWARCARETFAFLNAVDARHRIAR